MPASETAEKSHVITVALEDYYHVGAFNRLIQRGQWYRFETRFERNAERALDLLDRHNVKATFFVLGCIADEYPEVVRRVAERGHEVASKGYYHRSIRQMTQTEFREDLARSREALERAAGSRVVGYRVAHEWFLPDDLWALDVLAEEGYIYDSSICPTFRHYAKQPWRRFMHTHEHGGVRIWEFPLPGRHLLGFDIPIAGGNYFRQFPHWLVTREVDRWIGRSPHPYLMYFHVWELDPDQPKIKAVPYLTRMRHYRHLDRMESIVDQYFRRYRFTSIARHLDLDTRPDSTLTDRCDDDRPQQPPRRDQNRIPAWLPEAPTTSPGDGGPVADRTPISIVIPCFNEELILLYLANTLRSVRQALGRVYDVRLILVDDGSTDATWTSLQTIFADWPGVTLLRHQHNQGVTAALLTGLRKAETEIVCSIDCDCTYDPHELAKMIPLLEPRVDLVTASPYHPRGEVRNVPAWRLSLSRGASFLYRRVLRQKLHTYTSCFRVYRRSAIVDLEVTNMGFLGVAELLGRLDLNGSTVVEYPTTLEVRMLGRSKMKTLRTIAGHLGLLVRLFTLRLAGREPPGDGRKHSEESSPDPSASIRYHDTTRVSP